MFSIFNHKKNVIKTDLLADSADIHSHLLPGVDDGIQLREDSIAAFQGLHVDTSDALAVGLMPFASTEIRVIFGIVGFIVIMLLTRNWQKLVASVKDAKGMVAATGGTIFGPFLGVSFSLMAVRYTETGIASTLMALTPIIILLPSYLIYKQKISLKEIAGAVISVVGVSLFFI